MTACPKIAPAQQMPHSVQSEEPSGSGVGAGFVFFFPNENMLNRAADQSRSRIESYQV